MRRLRKIFLVIIPALTLGFLSCNKIDEFKRLGNKVASPIDVAVSDDGTYFYVLNSDFDRTYGSGSILVINEEGKKEAVVPTKRLGRAMTVAGDDMLALFDDDNDDDKPEIALYDLSGDNKAKPKRVKSWRGDDYKCNPISAVMRKGYNHFAVACRGGDLYIGTLKEPRTDSTLKLVRDYGITRRAMYLDPKRELLFAFVTDVGTQVSEDAIKEDVEGYDAEADEMIEGANEIPDDFENDDYQRENSSFRRKQYQYIIYNIKEERKAGFPFLDEDNSEDTRINNEMRWLYFTLKNHDGTPEDEAGVSDRDHKLYRTNFWEAKPDPFNSDAFYLSHRGQRRRESRFTNAIIHVTMDRNFKHSDDEGKPRFTEDILQFDMVYGFEGEFDDDSKHFTGDFEVQAINGRATLIINHFRDLFNFRNNHAFSVVARILDGGFWRDEVTSTKSRNSYYQIAANSRGKVLTCSFYGNSVIPLEVAPGTGITIGWNDIKRIK